MVTRRRPALTDREKPKAPEAPEPLVYTGQDLARFCEVDLKTIHNWADAGKITHHRTTGRHLRFRHVHVVAFLRRHGYPIHPELAGVRPTVFVAAALADPKKLAAQFHVRRFATAIEAIAHLVAGEPDVIVVAADDPTWSGVRAVSALRGSLETAWPVLVVVSDDAAGALATAMKEAGADLVIDAGDVGRLAVELGHMLGIE